MLYAILITLSVDTGVASTLWPLWVMLLWTSSCCGQVAAVVPVLNSFEYKLRSGWSQDFFVLNQILDYLNKNLNLSYWRIIRNGDRFLHCIFNSWAVLLVFHPLLLWTSDTYKRLPLRDFHWMCLWNSFLLIQAFISLIITWIISHRELLSCPRIFSEAFPVLLCINDIWQPLYNIRQTHYPLWVIMYLI